MTGCLKNIPHRAAVIAAGTVLVLLFTALQLGNIRTGAAASGEGFLLRQGILLVLAGTAAAFLAGFLLEYRTLSLPGTFLLCGFFLADLKTVFLYQREQLEPCHKPCRGRSVAL